jgi:hypothetical protein
MAAGTFLRFCRSMHPYRPDLARGCVRAGGSASVRCTVRRARYRVGRMTKTPGPAEVADEQSGAGSESVGEAPVTASHEILFELGAEVACDVCGARLGEPSDPDDDDSLDLRGNGVYMWTRGDSVRFEQAPLCASCASAIGMTALARWEIEEEEG